MPGPLMSQAELSSCRASSRRAELMPGPDHARTEPDDASPVTPRNYDLACTTVISSSQGRTCGTMLALTSHYMATNAKHPRYAPGAYGQGTGLVVRGAAPGAGGGALVRGKRPRCAFLGVGAGVRGASAGRGCGARCGCGGRDVGRRCGTGMRAPVWDGDVGRDAGAGAGDGMWGAGAGRGCGAPVWNAARRRVGLRSGAAPRGF
jgi:hypothetical protein